MKTGCLELCDCKEIWKPVTGRAEGFPYEVSSKGRVRRAGEAASNRTHIGYVLKPMTNTRGYLYIRLWLHGKRKTFRIHSLVADAFLGPPPGPIGGGPDDWQVNHKDGNKENCNLENIEWVTGRKNIEHAFATGLRNLTNNKNAAKVDKYIALEIRKKYATGNYTYEELANEYPLSHAQIGRIVTKECWPNI